MLYRWISPDFEQGYIHISPHISQANWIGHRQSVHATGIDGELLFLVIKSMPDEYRVKISQVIGGAYPEEWKHFSLGEAGRVGFHADHFCCWNRYSEHVCGYLFSVCGQIYTAFRGQVLLKTSIHLAS